MPLVLVLSGTIGHPERDREIKYNRIYQLIHRRTEAA